MAFAGMYGLAILMALGMIWWPMGRDQGVFVWVGDVILGGGIPYRDAWEVKGLATHYTYAVSQLLFGRTLWGIRVLDLMFLAVTLIVFHRLLRRFCNTLSVHFSTILLLLMYINKGYWNLMDRAGSKSEGTVAGLSFTT